MQHAIERGERPGESLEALDGKNMLHANRVCGSCAMRFASETWPRPDCRLWKHGISFINRTEGKDCHQVQGLVLASFLAPEIDMFFEDRVVSSWLSWYRGTLVSLTDWRWWFDSPAGPRVRLKTADPPKGNGLGQKNVF